MIDFKGHRYEKAIILLYIRWYLRRRHETEIYAL